MENKKYKLTEKELGDVFEGKIIYTNIDPNDLVAYISREKKDPVTGQRRYKHVPHTYMAGDGDVHNNVMYPPFPIWRIDMDLAHPPSKYLIKIVYRYNKAISNGGGCMKITSIIVLLILIVAGLHSQEKPCHGRHILKPVHIQV
ncbi:hypothetical protein ES705_19242 [subsurface metagenome]